METITEKLQEVIQAESHSQNNEAQIKSFQQASEQFEALVESGMAKRRGNQLLAIGETYSNTKSYLFNAPLGNLI